MSKRKHNVTELRKHQIMSRLNDSEFAEVSSRAKKFHQPIAVYVRNTILNPSLGTDYTKKELLSRIGRQSTLLSNPEYKKNPFAIFTYPSNLQLVVKLQDCVKAQQNKTYAQKVKLTNLQQMANTLISCKRIIMIL